MELLPYKNYDSFTPLGNGVNSHCFTDRKIVLKLTPVGSDKNQAQKKFNLLKGEYELFRDYLGEYVLESHLFVYRNSKEWAVGIEQEFIKGTPLRRSLNAKIPAVQDFFQRNLHLYVETGFIPDLLPDIMIDLSGGIYLVGKYTYRSGPNVYLVENKPILVDSTLNKSLRNRFTGPILRALVALRIKSLMR